MNENSFFKWFDVINLNEMAIPINLPTDLFLTYEGGAPHGVSYVDDDNVEIQSSNYNDFQILENQLYYMALCDAELTTASKAKRFYLRVYDSTNDKYRFSQPFVFTADTVNYSLLEYDNNTDAFGFKSGFPTKIVLPFMIKYPQFNQEDKIYIDSNGVRHVIFATISKEYELETNYIPIEWHEKLLIALSCDIVKINNELLTKSASYEIDYENELITDCGVKTYKATCKMAANQQKRNNNC